MKELNSNAYQNLCNLIDQWNENRLDLFSLSKPNENLEFYGVMRFYFQEAGEKVTTKCIRVLSTSTTEMVIQSLIEKFHPDMKMLTLPNYSIWEVHENGEEKKLKPNDCPLIAQLNWHKDDLEGRFLLKQETDLNLSNKTLSKNGSVNSLHRIHKRFSKRDKKKFKKTNENSKFYDDSPSIYAELPQNTFTRTISNPEIVMQKRREKKLENKLKEIENGGSLKIYGVELFPNKPYVTLLLNVNDSARKTINEALEKYGVEKKYYQDYVLVEIILSQNRSNLNRSLSDLNNVNMNQERYLNDNEFPLLNYINHSEAENVVYFLRKRNLSHLPCTEETSNKMCSIEDQQPFLLLINCNETERKDYKIFIKEGVNNIRIRESELIIHFFEKKVMLQPIQCNSPYLQINDKYILTITKLKDNDIINLICENLQFRFFYKNQNSFDTNSNNLKIKQNEILNIQSDLQQKETNFDTNLNKPIKTSEMIYATSNNFTNVNSTMELPILFQIPNQICEDELFQNELFGVPLTKFNFRLTPAFIMYIACRYNLSQLCLLGSVEKRLQRIYQFIDKFINLSCDCIHADTLNYDKLSFWLANLSEFLFILKSDVILKSLSLVLITRLTNLVEKNYMLLIDSCQIALRPTLHTILNLQIDDESSLHDIIKLLNIIFCLIQNSFLNSALTIQIFSQIFYYINMYIFNWIVTTKEKNIYITNLFGKHLEQRLKVIERWAEKRGLEQTYECHMDHLNQTIGLLKTPKDYTQLADLGATCYKLNSIQIRYLLENYNYDPAYEKPVFPKLIENVVYLAKQQADVTTTEDGSILQLEELPSLQLSFFIPMDGYFIESLKNIPPDLLSFAIFLQQKDIGRLIIQNFDLSSWTCHMTKNSLPNDSLIEEKSEYKLNSEYSKNYNYSTMSKEFDNLYDLHYSNLNNQNNFNYCNQIDLNNEVKNINQNYLNNANKNLNYETVTIYRNTNENIGLSIVAGQAAGESLIGIYVKKVIEGSPAHKNGCLSTGDQLLSVNGLNLVGITQEEAAQKISLAETEVCFKVLKNAAMRNGLEAWLKNDLNTNKLTERSFNYSQKLNSQNSYQNNKNSYSCNNQTVFSPYIQNNRSASVSELYSQIDPIVENNTFNNLSYDYKNDKPQSVQPNHQQQLSFSKLPSHYKLGNRPTVVQPNRPVSSPVNIRQNSYEPLTHLSSNLKNDNYSQIIRSNSTKLIDKNYTKDSENLVSYNSLTNFEKQNFLSSGPTDYGHLPLIKNNSNVLHNFSNAENGSINSSTTNSSAFSIIANREQPLKNLNQQIGLRNYFSGNLPSNGKILHNINNRHHYSNIQNTHQTNNNIETSDKIKYYDRFIENQIHAHSNSSSSTSSLPPPPNASLSSNSIHGYNNDCRKFNDALALKNFQNQRQNQYANQLQYNQHVFNSPKIFPNNRYVQKQQNFKKDFTVKQFPASGRRSAPLFGEKEAICNNEERKKKNAEELKREISQLELKKIQSHVDFENYQKHVQKLCSQNSNTTENSNCAQGFRQTHSASVLGFERPSPIIDKTGFYNLPFMLEMESRLEMKQPLRKTNVNNQSKIENIIDDVSKVANNLNNISLDSVDLVRSTTLGNSNKIISSPTNNHLKDSHLSLENNTLNKKTNFDCGLETTLQSLSQNNDAKKSSIKKLLSIDELSQVESIDNKNIETESFQKNNKTQNENEEPRTQIIGTNEVYNDPRQRRLTEFQARSLKHVIDGSNLGFRDKMKLFAEQLGEQAPKNKQKISSAQREIETMESA